MGGYDIISFVKHRVMKLALIVMNFYYKIGKVVVTLRGTASRLCLISRMKLEFFCLTGLTP